MTVNGVRDKGAVEAAVFRPQIGYYNSIEEAAALMESLGNNHGFLTVTSALLSPGPTFSCGATASISKSKAWTDTRSSMARWTGTNFALPKSSTGSARTSNLWFEPEQDWSWRVGSNIDAVACNSQARTCSLFSKDGLESPDESRQSTVIVFASIILLLAIFLIPSCLSASARGRWQLFIELLSTRTISCGFNF
jgi:hypothetical protein